MARYSITDVPSRIAVDRHGFAPKRGKLTVSNNLDEAGENAALRPIRVARQSFATGQRVGFRVDGGVVMSDDVGAWQGEWYAAIDDGTAGPYVIDVEDEPES